MDWPDMDYDWGYGHSNKLNHAQKIYIKDVNEEAQIKYYKMDFKFNEQVKNIYPKKLTVNARDLFNILLKEFKSYGY